MSVKQRALVEKEEKTNPETRLYMLIKCCHGHNYAVLVSYNEWKFIDDGIVTIQLKKALDARDIILYLSLDDYLMMSEKDRIKVVFGENPTFNNSWDAQEYAQANNIHIVEQKSITP